MKNRQGFTLIEVLCVIIVMAILALLVTPNVINRINESKKQIMVIQENKIAEASRIMLQDYCFNPINSTYKNNCIYLFKNSTAPKILKTSNGDLINKKYVCIEDIKANGYYDSDLKYNNEECYGFVVYQLNDETYKTISAKTYVTCGNEYTSAGIINKDISINDYSKCKGITENSSNYYYVIYNDGNGEEVRQCLFSGEEKDNTNKNCLSDKNYLIADNTFENGDYKFITWNTSKNGIGTTASVGENLLSVFPYEKAEGEEIILFAQWGKLEYQEKTIVYFNPNGGEINQKSKNVIINKEYGELPVPTRLGYEFLGWYLEKESPYTKIEPYTRVKIKNEHTLYAAWKADKTDFSATLIKCTVKENDTNYAMTYTGKCKASATNDGWKVEFLTSGDLYSNREIDIDAFLVGGGAGGGNANSDWCCYGGAGGAGGSRKTVRAIRLSDNSVNNIVIGYGGTSNNKGGNTKAFSYEVAGGLVGGPGSGTGSGMCGMKSSYSYGKTASDGSYAFNDKKFGSILYGAGGQGGICHNSSYVHCSNHYVYPGPAGKTGGADSCNSAKSNSGSGGGGGCTDWWPCAGGSGGSGIVIIRNVEKVYTVYYKGNGTVEGKNFSTVMSTLKKEKLKPNVFSLKGYIFTGWNTSPFATFPLYNDEEEVLLSTEYGKEISLYAIWKKVDYNITYDFGVLNKGEYAPIGADIGKSFEISKPSKDGYTFTGWKVVSGLNANNARYGNSPDSINNSIKNSDTLINAEYFINLTLTNYVKLKAIYKQNNYTIKYNDNNGNTAQINDTKYTYNNSLALTTTKPKKPGYTFLGWNVDKDATVAMTVEEIKSNLIKQEDKYVLTLYAIWEINTITINYNANKGIINNTCTKIIDNQLEDNPKYDISDSIEYGETISNTNEKYFIDDTGMIVSGEGKNITTKIIYNEQVEDTELIDVIGKESFNIIKEGYHLYLGKEWCTINNGTGICYDQTKKYSPVSFCKNIAKTKCTVELFVNWLVNTYYIAYKDNNGNIQNMINSKYTYSEKSNVTLSKSTFIKPGYTFVGWNTDQNATTILTSEQVKKELKMHDNNYTLTLYAIWKPNKVTINYNTNGSTLDTTNNTLSIKNGLLNNDNKTLTTIIENERPFPNPGLENPNDKNNINLVKKGYHIEKEKEWCLQATKPTVCFSTTSLKYKAEDFSSKVLNNTNTTISLFANFVANKYSIKFDPNGGTGTMNDVICTYGLQQKAPNSTFVKLGYTFESWKINVAGKENTYKPNSGMINLSTIENDVVTAYAQWTPIKYQVIFDPNGGKGSMNSIQYKYDEKKPISLSTFTYAKHMFVEWNTKADGSGKSFENGEEVINLTTSNKITLYAQWKESDYVIKYDYKFGNPGNNNPLGGDLNSVIIIDKPNRVGYTFEGWKVTSGLNLETAKYGNSSTNVNNKINNSNEIIKAIYYKDLTSKDKTVTLTAIWSNNKYTITYDDANNNEKPISNTIYKYDNNLILTASKPIRLGYTFLGWNINKNATTIMTSAEVKSELLKNDNNYNLILYAIWKPNKVTITYNVNGGTINTTNKDYTTTNYLVSRDKKTLETVINYNGTLPSNGLENPDNEKYLNIIKKGYHIEEGKEWCLQATKPTTCFSDTSLEYKAEDFSSKVLNNTNTSVPLYVNFVENKYSIKYDPNGGIGIMNDDLCTFKTIPTAPNNLFTREGYTFASWNINYNGKNYEYKASSKMIDFITENNGTITAYAKWTPIKYKVKYNANGGTGTMNPVQHAYDAYKILSNNTFKYQKHKFVGWNTKADGSGKSYENEERVINLTTSSEIVLYAQWIIAEYTVEYNSHGGLGSMDNQIFKYSTTYNLSKNTIYKDGYTFVKWNTKADGRGKSYFDEQEIKDMPAEDNKTVILYAQWIPNTYTISFNPNGGDKIMADMSCTVDKEITLLSNTYVKTGYIFDGWNTKSDGSGIIYNNKDKVKNLILADNGRVILYAQWTPIKYNVKYNANGGTGTMSSVQHIYDVNATLSTNIFKYQGHKFIGWNTIKNGKGTMYKENEQIINLTSTANASVTLYAQWEKNK